MKNLVFIGLNQVGDTAISLLTIEALCKEVPELSIHVYNKGNIPNAVSIFLKTCPNIKSCQGLGKSFFSKKLYSDCYNLHKKIKELLKEGDVCVSSLLGAGTIFSVLLPFLLWLKLTQKNKLHILQTFPKWFKHDCHLVEFHCNLFSKAFNKKIEYTEHLSTFSTNKAVKPKTMAILPGASRLFKALPAQTFANVVNHFAKQGWEITILGSNTTIDVTKAEKIATLVPSNVKNLTGKTTLDEYIQTIANSSYVLANDSSGQHIAHICKTPSAIFWGRHKDGQIVKSYAWQDNLTLNIFNNPYQFCTKCTIFNKFKTQKQILKNHANCKPCIKQNLEMLKSETIISQIENHLQGF